MLAETGFIIIIALLIGLGIGFIAGRIISSFLFSKKVPKIRQDAVNRSRAVLAGQISEQMAPYFPGFPYLPSEVRFIGKPVDFIVFRGLDEKSVQEIVFIEIKTGKSQVNTNEKSIREAVLSGRVRWEQYRLP